jgi:hypothetical protein
MALTINLGTYDQDTPQSSNWYRYLGPNHDLKLSDYADVKRVYAKPTADFAGQAKSEVKLTRSLTDGVASEPVGKGIISISTSFPVDAASAEIDAAIDDLAAFMATATFKDIVKKQDINH